MSRYGALIATLPTHGDPSAQSLMPCLRSIVGGTWDVKGAPQSVSVDMWYSVMRSGELGSVASVSYAVFSGVLYVAPTSR